MADPAALAAIRADRAALVRALTDAGGIIKGNAVKCCFHADTSPSGGIHATDRGEFLYTCQVCDWNAGKRTGDVFAVVMTARRCTFPAAVAALTGDNGSAVSRHVTSKPVATRTTKPPDLARAQRLATECANRLRGDGAALKDLWRTRAIDAATAVRFAIGTTGDAKYWTLPITDASGKFVGLKHHARQTGTAPKCFWTPEGVPSAHTWPVAIESSGPVWLCPGELKALALISAGVPSVGITNGETNALPPNLLGALAGRAVAVVPDADPAGKTWLEKYVRPAMKSRGLDVRAVDLHLSGGADVQDWVVTEAVENGREAEAIRQALAHAYTLADPWRRYAIGGILDSPATWARVAHIPTGLHSFDAMTGGGLRIGAVHLAAGRPGCGKTQWVSQIVLNAAQHGNPAGLISCELDRDEIGRLMVAQFANLSRTRLDHGTLSVHESVAFHEAIPQLRRLPISVLDREQWQGGLDRQKLSDIVAHGVQRYGWRLVCLDYLGLLAPIETDRSDYQSDILNSATLRRIAKENQIALLVVVSLRKPPAAKKRADAPSLDDLCGASRIGYDCATAWHLLSQQYETGGGNLTVVPLKTRFSAAAHRAQTVEFVWLPESGRIASYMEPAKG